MSPATTRPRPNKIVPAPQPAGKTAPNTTATARKISDLRRRMQQDLQLAGLSERTQEACLRAVRQLATHFKTPPDQLTEVQLREYLLFLKNDKQFAAASLKIAFCGIKFFYTHTTPRDWQTLERIRVPRPKALPDVLTTDEVRRRSMPSARPTTGPTSGPFTRWGCACKKGCTCKSAISIASGCWCTCIVAKEPARALSIVFRAKFREAMQKAGLYGQIDPAVWRQDWVVHSRPAGDGQASLKYLAPYVFRVALSDRRIVSYDDQTVTFSYRKSGSRRWRKMTLDAMEFLRRFLQHVLPAGFQKVRHYGF